MTGVSYMTMAVSLFTLVFMLAAGWPPARQEAKNVSARPNLSGHWRIDEAKSTTNGSTGWFGNDLLVTQDDKSVTFAATGDGPGTGRSTFATDGAETRRQPRADVTTVEKAAWKGNQLVITTSTTRSDKSSSTRTVTVVLDRDDSLIVDVTVSPPSTSRFATHTVYRRAKT
jgi:hypothetical protein